MRGAVILKAKKITPEQFEHARKMTFDKVKDNLPKAVNKWIDDDVLKYSRYLFTHREGGVRYGYCTHCHKEVALELGRTYTEQDFINIHRRHKEKGFCPSCHSNVEFRDANRGRKYMTDKEYIIFATPLNDGGVLVRAGLIYRDYAQDYRCVETIFDEEYRVYYNTDVDVAWVKRWVYRLGEWDKDWQNMTTIPSPTSKQPWYTNACNYAYNHFYGFTNEAFKNTNLKYSQISEYMKKDTDPCAYLDTYVKYPVLTEKLIKEGFADLARNVAWVNVVINRRKTTVTSALGLTKGDLRELKSKSRDEVLYMQMARKYDITYEQARKFLIYDLVERLPKIEKHLPIKKAINYLEKQKEQICTLLDYWSDCKELRLDLGRENILFPPNLKQAHQRTIAVVNEKRARKRLAEAQKAEKEFARRLSKYKKKYTFASGQFFIRPAESGEELISEGMELHHCVGGYVQKYIKGETVILFVRKQSEPDKPFYTMEIDKHDSMVQCRGKFNCGRTPEVEQFVSEFLENLRSNKSKPQKAQVA